MQNLWAIKLQEHNFENMCKSKKRMMYNMQWVYTLVLTISVFIIIHTVTHMYIHGDAMLTIICVFQLYF